MIHTSYLNEFSDIISQFLKKFNASRTSLCIRAVFLSFATLRQPLRERKTPAAHKQTFFEAG